MSDLDDELLSKLDSKCGRLQRIILEMCRADPGKTSCRFIFYELIAKGVIPKHDVNVKRTDQPVSVALMHLRQVGLIPWDQIIDETRSVRDWRSAPTIADYVTDSVEIARIDPWDGDPPVFITESRSLAGILDDLAYRYVVPIVPTNGQVGGFLHTDVAPLLKPGQRVRYLGDWDKAGGDIEANTRNVLEELIGGELDWERLAITERQIEQHNLTKILKPDHRFKPVQYHEAVETEALGKNIIIDIVRRELDFLLPEPIEDIQVREAKQQAKVRRALSLIARRS